MLIDVLGFLKLKVQHEGSHWKMFGSQKRLVENTRNNNNNNNYNNNYNDNIIIIIIITIMFL